jgi:hypothetical protein
MEDHTMPNAIELLTRDHETLRALLPRLSDDTIGGTEKKEILARVEKELKIHAIVEEEIFYPAFKEAAKKSDEAKDMYYEALEEHHVVDMLLPEMKGLDGDSDGFKAKGKVLRELVEHHAGEEEREMFLQARELMDDRILMDLGIQMSERKQELDAQWDSVLAGAVRKVQSVADKFLPTRMKEVRGRLHHDESDRERRP